MLGLGCFGTALGVPGGLADVYQRTGRCNALCALAHDSAVGYMRRPALRALDFMDVVWYYGPVVLLLGRAVLT